MHKKILNKRQEIDTNMFSRSLIINCLICNLAFKTENGLKVHMEFVHLIPPDMEDELDYKYCTLE